LYLKLKVCKATLQGLKHAHLILFFRKCLDLLIDIGHGKNKFVSNFIP